MQLQQKGSFVMDRELKVQMDANLENQGLARAVAAAYVSQADPTVEELTEVKTAVSEAFSNAAIHGYENRGGIVKMEFSFISKDNGKLDALIAGKSYDQQVYANVTISQNFDVDFSYEIADITDNENQDITFN